MISTGSVRVVFLLSVGGTCDSEIGNPEIAAQIGPAVPPLVRLRWSMWLPRHGDDCRSECSVVSEWCHASGWPEPSPGALRPQVAKAKPGRSVPGQELRKVNGRRYLERPHPYPAYSMTVAGGCDICARVMPWLHSRDPAREQDHGLPDQCPAAGDDRLGALARADRIQGQRHALDGRHVPLGEHEESSPNSACWACRCRRNTAASACRSWIPP